MGLLNGSFEDWNFGTLFSDPADGAQLADNWYWHQGSAGSSNIINRVISSPSPFEGTYSMRITAYSGGAGTNTNTYVYQDISNYTDYLDQNITVKVAIYTQSVTPSATGHFFVDDGVTVTHSSSNSADDTWNYISLIFHVSPSATRLRIGVMPNTYQLSPPFFDAVEVTINLEQLLSDSVSMTENFFFVLNGAIQLALTDSMVIADSLIPPTGPVTRNKAVDDTVLLQDWLRIKRRPKQWGN